MRFVQLSRVSLLVAVIVLGTLAGCNSYQWPFPTQHSAVDDGWGDAYETNVAEMTVNPDAGQVGEPIALDPRTGELVDQGYQESQKLPASDSGLSSLIKIESGQ